jgi:uncharacterized damage-inducible protein DinB
MLSASGIRDHFRYSEWANARLLEAAAQVSPEDAIRDSGISHVSLQGLLVHLYGADRLWYRRIVEGRSPSGLFDAEEDVSMLRALRDLPAQCRLWVEWADRLTDAEAVEIKHYGDMKGAARHEPTWAVVAHVVNHSTYHRGQIASVLKQLGHQPPGTDYIVWYRDQARK